MTRRWLTAFVYAVAALAMADRLLCYRDLGLDFGLSTSAKIAVAGCVVLGLASLIALFELRAGVVLGLVGVCLSWRYFGELVAYFPWHNFAGAVYQMCGWPEVTGIFALVAATLCSLFPLRPGRMRGRPFERLRIVLPAVQMLIAVTYAVLKSFKALPFDSYRLMHLVWEVNYPLLVVWLPAAYALDWLGRFPPYVSGWISTAVEILIIALFLSSMALFWYFVATEIELRRQGKSGLRFTGTFKESLAVGILFLFGALALFYAYGIRLNWITPWRGRTTPLEVAICHGDLFFRRLIMVIWGLVFLRLAIHDLIVVWIRKEPLTSTPASRAVGQGVN